MNNAREPGLAVQASAGRVEQAELRMHAWLGRPQGSLLKPWITRQAIGTLAGFHTSLIETDNGAPALVVSRWALTKTFTTTREFDDWIAHVAPGLASGDAA